MKEHFFQRFLDRKSQDASPRSRSLLLESLESREMLNVDWSGFGAERVSTYEASSDALYSVELTKNVDACELVDLTGDGRNELVTFNFATKTASVYANTANNGDFTLKSSQTLDSMSGMSSGYDSVIALDNSLIVVSTSSSGDAVKATTYTWNSTSSKLVKSGEANLDVSKLNSNDSSIFLVTRVSAAMLGTSLVLQADTLTLNGTSSNKTVVYSGYGDSSFGEKSTVVSAISEKLMGSTTIDGTNYLILNNQTSTTNELVLAEVGSTVSKYTYNFGSYGSTITFDWVVDQGGFLVVGAMQGGVNSGLITIKASKPSGNVDASTLGQWIPCESLKFDSSSRAAIGNIGGDSDPELFVVKDSSYLFYLGDASNTYGYTFTEDSLVVTSPEYVSIHVGDINNDQSTEALLVGSNYIYTAPVSASGEVGDPTSRYHFSQPVKKAVFGDFNGDGLTDVAVQYKATIGSSLQVFQQMSDGSFIARASQSFGSALVDVAVGKFSQTTVDEIAVTYARSSSSTSTTVATLMLSPSSSTSAFTTTRSYSASAVVGSSLAVGSIYGSGYDDLVLASATQDTITVLRNTGSALAASTITTAFDSTSKNPVSVAIGDFNGDGLADVAALNSSSGSNYASVVYYLRSESTGLGSKPTGKIAINGAITVDSLLSSDLNSDGYCDLVFVRQGTNGAVALSALMGNGGSGVFDSAVNKAVTVNPNAAYGATLARVDGGNVSYDFAWAQDKTVGVLLNGDESSASGEIRFVCQKASSPAGDSLTAALATERTWIDEWSNYYVDVWANANGAAITSVNAVLNFNNAYFVATGVTAASGFSVSNVVENGTVTVVATGSGTADSNGWTLVGRIKFEPIGSLESSDGVGVPIPEDGVLKALNAGLSAPASSQSVNGSLVESATAPTALKLYPYIFDIDDNGVLNTNDMTYMVQYIGTNVSAISTPKYRIFDYDQNGTINMNDFSYLAQALGLSAKSGLDSIYSGDPSTSSSSAVLDDYFAAAVLEDELDDSYVAAVAKDVATIEDQPIEKVGVRAALSYYAQPQNDEDEDDDAFAILHSLLDADL